MCAVTFWVRQSLGVPYRADEWITDIWLRETDGRWLCVKSQKMDVAG